MSSLLIVPDIAFNPELFQRSTDRSYHRQLLPHLLKSTKMDVPVAVKFCRDFEMDGIYFLCLCSKCFHRR